MHSRTHACRTHKLISVPIGTEIIFCETRAYSSAAGQRAALGLNALLCQGCVKETCSPRKSERTTVNE